MKRIISGIKLTLLLMGMLTLVFNIQPVRASGTIYIGADGSVDPPTAPIQRDGDRYTFTDNIYDSIVVEKDNIVVDGAGYFVQGEGARYSKGIDLRQRRNLTIRNATVKGFYYGISLLGSSNNTIIGNTFVANNLAGIHVDLSNNNIIVGNTLVNDGLYIYESYGNVVYDNLVNSKPLVYLESSSEYIVRDAGQVILINCSRIKVENLNLSHTSVGIQLWKTTNTEIVGNNITANNSHGIFLGRSSKNNISGNNITANIWFGIWLWWSSNNNSICENIIRANKIGILMQHSSYNNVSRNNIANKQDGIFLDCSSNNTVSENNVTDNLWRGVMLDYSWNNTVSQNNVTNSIVGVRFVSALNNTISKNNVRSNNYGVGIFFESDNRLYHNNFINNVEQVYFYYSDDANIWDNGYPSGGNYWSDYADRYPNATEIDGSGIWDTPYIIDPNNQDNCPLTEPWTPVPPVEDTEAYMDYVNETIQELPDEIFNRSGEDVADVKNDFSDLFNDTLENIDEGNYEGAIEKLDRIKEKIYEEIVESADRREIISRIDDLIGYLESFL